VVLMDVQMPGMDGFAATQLLRESERAGLRRVPIIGLTAHALRGDRERCLTAGMDDYLTKPVAASQLYEMVERWAQLTPTPEAPVGNTNAIERLIHRLGAEKMNQLRPALARSLTEGLSDLRDALARGNAQEAGFAAHRLRGSLVVFGFEEAATLTAAIESRCTAARLPDAQPTLASLAVEVDRIVAALGSHANP
jgi:CheY-like chemotaxis protein